jgi:hypothetical protein
MLFVVTLSCEMQDVTRVSHISPYPIRNVFSKAAIDLGFISCKIGFAKFLQARFCPISHWYHDFFLVHIEFFRLIKL